jgi:DNA-binding IclR family transcriptional regulator
LDYSGETAPLYCTRVGKSILAFLPRSRQEQVLGGKMVPYTQHTITDPEELARELALIRERGYAIDRAEHEYDIACVAVPILNEFGAPIAAVSVSGLDAHFSEEKIGEFCKYLKRTTERVQMYL